MIKLFKLFLVAFFVFAQPTFAQSQDAKNSIKFTELSKKLNKMEENLKSEKMSFENLEEETSFL